MTDAPVRVLGLCHLALHEARDIAPGGALDHLGFAVGSPEEDPDGNLARVLWLPA